MRCLVDVYLINVSNATIYMVRLYLELLHFIQCLFRNALGVGSLKAIVENESFVACECCRRLDLGRINTDCHGFVSYPVPYLLLRPIS